MIERLLRHPGGEIASYDLIHGPTAIEVNAGPEHSDFEPNAFVATKFSHSGEMLDKQAKREYQLRLAVLEEQLAELKATGDPEQALEVEAEIEFLRREISRAFAFGGRSRRAGLATERARLNATRAIRAALLKISDQNAEFGQQLSASIRTGLFCCYQPRHDRKIIWELSDDSRNASPGQAMDLLDAVPPMPIAALTSGSIFIGRKNELEILRSLLNRIRRGEGTIALLSGEPGVGKTRTAAEIAIIATELGMLAFAGSCYDRDDLIPYLPFVEILERVVAAWKQPRRLQELLGYDASEIARLVPAIHALVPDVSRPLEVAPEQSQRILFNAVAGFLTQVAATQPLLLILDDLQWAGEQTLQLLLHISLSLVAVPLLIIGTYRDYTAESQPLAQALNELIRWRNTAQITLSGLPADEVAVMLRALGGRGFPAQLVNRICEYTDGNPFYIEELFSHLMEQGKLIEASGEVRGDLGVENSELPPSLRIVLGQRLARLSQNGRRTLATASIIGRSFTFALLERATSAEPDMLLDCLEEAEGAGLIAASEEFSEARFSFRHELIRRALEASITGPRRQRIHVAIARAIEALATTPTNQFASDIAHHLWHAGAFADPQKTLRHMLMAVKSDLDQSAYESARKRLERVTRVLARPPVSESRSQSELECQIALAVALLGIKGWHDSEVGAAYQRAYESWRGSNDDPNYFSILFGLWTNRLVRAEHLEARAYAEQLVRIAPYLREPELEVQAYWALGCSQFYMAEFAAAHASLNQVIDSYDRDKHRSIAFRFGQDPCMSALVFDSQVLWLMGYIDQSQVIEGRALALARALHHPFTMAWCLGILCMADAQKKNFAAAEEHIREGLQISGESGFSDLAINFQNIRTLCMMLQGRAHEARAEARLADPHSGPAGQRASPAVRFSRISRRPRPGRRN